MVSCFKTEVLNLQCFFFFFFFHEQGRPSSQVTESNAIDHCHMDFVVLMHYALRKHPFTALTSVNLTAVQESPEKFEVHRTVSALSPSLLQLTVV